MAASGVSVLLPCLQACIWTCTHESSVRGRAAPIMLVRYCNSTASTMVERISTAAVRPQSIAQPVSGDASRMSSSSDEDAAAPFACAATPTPSSAAASGCAAAPMPPPAAAAIMRATAASASSAATSSSSSSEDSSPPRCPTSDAPLPPSESESSGSPAPISATSSSSDAEDSPSESLQSRTFSSAGGQSHVDSGQHR